MPTESWFPEDGFEDGTGGRRRDDVVGNPFDFHLWASKAGEVASDFQAKTFHRACPLVKIWCSPGSTLKKKKGRASDQCGYEQCIDWRIGPYANPSIGASRAPTLTVLIID